MKDAEDEAFDEIERRQGGGFKAKQAMAMDKVSPFEKWWYYEGSGPPQKGEDYEEHTKRMCEIAWSNGADVAAQSAQEPMATVMATVTSETGNPDVTMSWWHEPALPVGTKLYTASPQPAQEPVAWGVFEGNNLHDMLFTQEEAQELAGYKGSHAEVRPLYTTPPKREWVGLTPEEINAVNAGFTSSSSFHAGALWAQAKLKEKNFD